MVLDEPDSPSTQADAVQLAKGAGFCKAGDTVIVAYRDHVSPAKDLALKILVVRERERLKKHEAAPCAVLLRSSQRRA